MLIQHQRYLFLIGDSQFENLDYNAGISNSLIRVTQEQLRIAVGMVSGFTSQDYPSTDFPKLKLIKGYKITTGLGLRDSKFLIELAKYIIETYSTPDWESKFFGKPNDQPV